VGEQFISLLQKIPRLALGPNQYAILHRQWEVLPLRVEGLQSTVGQSPSSNVKVKQKQGTVSTAIHEQIELDLIRVA